MNTWFVLPLLSPRSKGVPGVFAAVSIRKRGSEISVGKGVQMSGFLSQSNPRQKPVTRAQ